MAITERESNNTFATAQNIGTLSGSETITGGSINARTSNDFADVFKFRVDRNSRFAATLLPSRENVNLVLSNSSGQTLDFSNNSGTTSDRVTSDNLTPGDYFLSATGGSNTFTNYSLSMNATPITVARLGTTIQRVTTDGSFGDTPDFVARATIDGTRQQTQKIESKDAVFNRTLSRFVDINKLSIPIQLSVVDEDPGRDDVADLNPARGVRDLFLNYDVVRGRTNGSGVNNRRDGETIVVTGNGDDDKATTIRFSVNYDTFTFGSSASFNSLSNASTFVGKNRSGRFVGENGAGILDGRGGNDDLSGMGGNDVVIGGLGNDTMRGGKGNDITYGGIGNDVHIGGFGRDTFVLHHGQGVDVIKDYRDGVDKIGLVEGMTYEALDIRQHGRSVGIYAGNDRMAMVRNARSNQLNATDFVQVAFTEIQGMNTPLVL